jgi:hypothetical protein
MTHEFQRDQRARKRTRNSRDALRVPVVALGLSENAMTLRAARRDIFAAGRAVGLVELRILLVEQGMLIIGLGIFLVGVGCR